MITTLATVNSNLTPIHLIGEVGEAIGRERFDLDVASPAEAIRAINILTRGKLENYLRGPGKDQKYQVALQNTENAIDKEEIEHKSGRSAIYIMPAIEGRDSGFKKIITGAALVALAFFSGGLSAATTSFAFFAASTAVAFGGSLILGGITQLLTPTPKGPSTSIEAEARSSSTFQGNATAVVQGGCVPVVYGRMIVSPIPISISIENNDAPITEAGTVGSVDKTDLSGGGTQYTPGISEPI